MIDIIKKEVCYEDIISRTPGLFPYIEKDEYGILKLHKATDSKSGCYGKVIPNLIIDGVEYSYRDIVRKYNDGTLKENKTINDGIGKFKVDETIEGELVPEYMFYPQMVEFYDFLEKYSGVCDCSNKNYSDNIDFCCICKKYCDYGGNNMLNFLKNKIKECENIASDFISKIPENGYGYLDFNIALNGNSIDYGIETIYSEEWIPGKGYVYGDVVIYNENTYILDNKSYTNDNMYYGYYDSEINEILFDENEWKIYKDFNGNVNDAINSEADSKLTSLRRTKRFLNDDGTEVSIPKENENTDWLCLYQVGLVLNINTIVDDDGNLKYFDNVHENNLYYANNENIHSLSENDTIPNDYSDRLIAYGDVITDIKVNKEDCSITFNYSIGCHLIGNNIQEIEGETIFDKKQYKFEYFSIDENYKGVEYEETYYYDEEEFGDFDLNNPDESAKNGVYGIFKTSSIKVDIEKTFSDESVVVSDRISNVSAKKSAQDFIKSSTFRKEEYNGITFKPIVDVDVLVDRGINAAFEKHIKLGEVKTMEDLENYGNGGFFNIENVTNE